MSSFQAVSINIHRAKVYFGVQLIDYFGPFHYIISNFPETWYLWKCTMRNS